MRGDPEYAASLIEVLYSNELGELIRGGALLFPRHGHPTSHGPQRDKHTRLSWLIYVVTKQRHTSSRDVFFCYIPRITGHGTASLCRYDFGKISGRDQW